MRLGIRHIAAFAVIFQLGVTSPAQAQVVAPVVVERAEAELPRDFHSETSLAVELEITVNVDGSVADARVVEGPGDPLDSAALDAIVRSRFAPATSDGTPTPVRIRYRYVFPPVATETPDETATAVEPEAPAEPDPAPVDSVAKAPSLVEEQTDQGADEEPTYGARAVIDAPLREPTRRTIRREELSRVPGTQGDAIHAIELLPGVGRSTLGNDPIIRGAAGFETQVFFDGAPVPILYHLGGIKSFVNSRLIDRIDLYPGNFSVRYGRLVGGVIDVRSRDIRTDGFHAVADVSLLDSSALVESPLGESAGVLLAARRSNVDFFFENFVSDDDFSVVAAPLYWDYQGIGQVDVGDESRLRLMAYGSRDSLKFFFAEPGDVDPTLRGKLEGAIEFHRLQANLHTPFDQALSHELMLNVGTQSGDFVLGPTAQSHFDALDIAGRSEWRVRTSRWLDVVVGIDATAQYFEGKYVGDAPPQGEGAPDADRFGTNRTVEIEDGFWLPSPAGYLELSLRPIDRLLLVPGLRVDYFHQLRAVSADPRLAIRYELNESTALKGGVGLFTQPPQYYEALHTIGNPALDPYRALHTSVGVEKSFGKKYSFETEAFYKRLVDRVVATPGGEPPRFSNDGVGRVYGLEFGANVRPTDSTGAYLSYTLSRSERRDRNRPWRPFDYDQTHVLSVAANQDLGRGWEIGARFRYVTGNPITPVVGSQYDATRDLYIPLYGPVNSARSSAFNQLDLRAQKTWDISPLRVSVYLDVMNVYNAQNQEGLNYGYDYSKREKVSGFPIFPNLGVRGEL